MPPRPWSRAPRARRQSSGPCRARNASRPPKCTNATVTTRCSGEPPPASTCSWTASGMNSRRSMSERPRGVGGRRRAAAPARGEGGTRLRAGRPRNPRAVCSRGGADDDLAGARAVLHRDDFARRRPDHKELAARRADEEAVERARVDTDRHTQRDVAGGGLQLAGYAQALAHRRRRPHCSVSVVIATKHEQEGVAAELQQSTTRVVRDGQQLGKARADRVGDLLGTDATVTRQALGHRREAGEVGEHHGAGDGPPKIVGSRCRPVGDQARHVGWQHRRVRKLSHADPEIHGPTLEHRARGHPSIRTFGETGEGAQLLAHHHEVARRQEHRHTRPSTSRRRRNSNFTTSRLRSPSTGSTRYVITDIAERDRVRCAE